MKGASWHFSKMEFRDRLLSSDMHHVTELVNLLSYEVVILQDFLQLQFGTKFTQFRDRHQLSSTLAANKSKDKHVETSTSQPNNRKMTTRQSGSRTEKLDAKSNPEEDTGSNSEVDSIPIVAKIKEVGNVDPLSNDELHSEEEESFADGPEVFMAEDNDNDLHFADSDMESYSCNDNGSGNIKKSLGQRIHRKTKFIWSKFDWTKLPNGKRYARCRECGQQVSPVPKRLEKHYHRCVLGDKSYEPNVSKSPSELGQRAKSNATRKYFNETTNSDGKVIITCKYCNKNVSNHITRMSKHLENCTKAPEEDFVV